MPQVLPPGDLDFLIHCALAGIVPAPFSRCLTESVHIGAIAAEIIKNQAGKAKQKYS
jgi:hypothetical protein